MPDYTAKRIGEMRGPMKGHFKLARAELGVTSFGMQVLEFPPNADRYPAHDHVGDGQEEVFVVLRGSGEIDVDGERTALDPDVMVRVGPAAKRMVYAGPEGLRLLALGGTPGRAYEPTEFTELRAPDPTAS